MAPNRRRLLSAYFQRLRQKSLGETLKAGLDPKRLRMHLGNVIAGEVQERSNPYRPSLSPIEEARFCAEVLERPEPEAHAIFDELETDVAFVSDLRERYARLRPEWPEGLHLGRFRVWYAIVRLCRPGIVAETGVHDGLSSALILKALDRNGQGELISVDLPSMDMPAGVDGPGWLVPQELRSRWRLHLGDARKLLPELVGQYPRIDVFIHDSDHSREHREFEFCTVRPVVGSGGLMLSDDDADDLLDVLAAEWSARRHRLTSVLPDGDSAHIGGLRL